MKKILPLVFALLALQAEATVKKVLFLGNSYTYVNDLPNLLRQLSESHGDTISVDSYAPGGYTLQQHSTDVNALTKIAQGGWDFVIIQEQSQLPSFPPSQVESQVYPFAKTLDSLVHVSSPCAETVFYMTWGRKNGDASNCGFYPLICTYEGMQSRLRESYMQMATDNNATVAPCGMAWKRIRETDSTIVLYQADESHPEIAGSYLNACVFYTSLFHKSSLNSGFISTLPDSIAHKLQAASDFVVFDSLAQWQQYGNLVSADFSYMVSGSSVAFTQHCLNANNYLWNFGDGNGSTLAFPTNNFSQAGIYQVILTASNDCHSETVLKNVSAQQPNNIGALAQSSVQIYPTIVTDKLLVESDLQEAEIELFSVSGQLLLGQQLEAGTYTINMESIAPQPLFYTIKSGGRVIQHGQLVKQ